MLRFLIPFFLILTFANILSLSAQVRCTASQIFDETNCVGDSISSDETRLVELVNRYRAANGKSALKLSTPLSMVANRRVLDLQQNMRMLTHSWSNCRYDINDVKTFDCVSEAPRRLRSGYDGSAFETLYRNDTGTAAPAAALAAWKKSSLHNSIILDLGEFKDKVWTDIGVAVDGQYASLWFGSTVRSIAPMKSGDLGLVLSFDQAISALGPTVFIKQVSTAPSSNIWSGGGAGGSLRIEIQGKPEEIDQITLDIKMNSDKGVSPAAMKAVASLLKNVFPEWSNIEDWLDRSVAAINSDRTRTQTKLIRGISVDIGTGPSDSIRILIHHRSKPTVLEIK